MTDPREPPQSIVQATGQVASDVVSGLKSQPVLLGLLVLNAIGVSAAVWFLGRLVENSQTRWELLLKACMPHVGGTP